jgi:hypothetical protein
MIGTSINKPFSSHKSNLVQLTEFVEENECQDEMNRMNRGTWLLSSIRCCGKESTENGMSASLNTVGIVPESEI